jgi:14-3-3 protein epsilon
MSESKMFEREMTHVMLALRTKNFDKMTEIMVDMIKRKKEDLNEEERELFTIALRNTFHSRKKAIKVCVAGEEFMDCLRYPLHLDEIVWYKNKIIKERKDWCELLIDTIESHLIPKSVDTDNKSLYTKLIADYYRYIAEYSEGEEKQKSLDKSLEYYKQATELAKCLPEENPTKMGIALNFSLFYAELLNDKTIAKKIAYECLQNSEEVLCRINMNDWDYEKSFKISDYLWHNYRLWKNQNFDDFR